MMPPSGMRLVGMESVAMAKKRELRLPALQVRQGPKRMLYVFSVDGKLVHRFATISRVRRDEEGALRGYQRPEVLSHIDEIKRFIEGPNPMIPNAVVLAFNSSVHFEAADSEFHAEGYSRPGTLRIPFEEEMLDEDKPAFVVDGQQRLAAVRDSSLDSFPLSVVAFITDDVAEQTDQFILVNSTKPLAKGLVYELLPNTESRLPSSLLKKRFPSQLLTILNAKRHSPFRGLIQTPTNPGGMIKDNSILKMLENSLNEGVLYRFRSDDGAGGSVDTMITILCAYWGGQRRLPGRLGEVTEEVAPHARGRNPEHGPAHGCHRRPLPEPDPPQEGSVRPGSAAPEEHLPVDRWVLGSRHGTEAQVERDREHPLRHQAALHVPPR
jgi:DGQHR domain-containing protein